MDIDIFTRINTNKRPPSQEDVDWLCTELCKFQSENDRLKLHVENAGKMLYCAIRELSVIASDKNALS